MLVRKLTMTVEDFTDNTLLCILSIFPMMYLCVEVCHRTLLKLEICWTIEVGWQSKLPLLLIKVCAGPYVNLVDFLSCHGEKLIFVWKWNANWNCRAVFSPVYMFCVPGSFCLIIPLSVLVLQEDRFFDKIIYLPVC